jgi:glycosyltransferase involved in cell wall biosynthesis
LPGEHFLPYLYTVPREVLARTVVTLHQPHAQWRPDSLRALAGLQHVMLLFTPTRGSFDIHLAEQPRIIRHGVDTAHFAPATAPRERRVLYSGVHLRNLPMLERVLRQLFARDPHVVVDMLVPMAHRSREAFSRLANLPRLQWHAGLDDAALLALYRRCSVMLLPLQDSGANTAVVEALSCGLPLVTTRVGGISDYGGGSVYPVVDNDDDGLAVDLLVRLLDDSGHHALWAARGRAFALEHLCWSRTVPEHLNVYMALAPRPGPGFRA